jgi:hypothetical protein
VLPLLPTSRSPSPQVIPAQGDGLLLVSSFRQKAVTQSRPVEEEAVPAAAHRGDDAFLTTGAGMRTAWLRLLRNSLVMATMPPLE